MSFQLKHIKGVPYFVKDTRVYTFELEHGQPSKQCVAIGTYDEATDTITYDDEWFERIRDRLETFRRGVEVVERDKLRESVDKPQKQRKSIAAKPKSVRAKSVAGK
jgi:hypothetical protein